MSSDSIPPLSATGEYVVRPRPAPGPLANPLKGWCPYTDAGPITQPYSMVFQYVSWRELEPREGEYGFAEWEQRAWDVPAAQGKHVLLRVYIDYPAQASGLPDWLRAKGVPMRPYTDYQEMAAPAARSLAPDYDHPVLLAALERLIAALGQRYNHDPRVAFLQLGTLGFWGEWHTYPREGLFASKPTQQRVVEAYHAAFPDKKLMARYAGFYTGKQPWLGFHDDLFPEDTDTSIDWHFLSGIRKAGRQQNWRRAVLGGEMVPNAAQKWLGPEYAHTRRMVDAAHMTWVGPYCPALEADPTPEFTARCAELVRRMGYQFALTELRYAAKLPRGDALTLHLAGKNTGVAPFYYPWPVRLALLNARRQIVASAPLAIDIRTWQPGAFRASVTVNLRVEPGTYTPALGILDPWTKKPAIAFATTLPVEQGWTLLPSLVVTG